MTRSRLAGAIILAGVGLYLAGILLPYLSIHGSLVRARGVLVFGPTSGTESALNFGGYRNWSAATPLVLMFVVAVAALGVVQHRRSEIHGGIAASVGLALLLLSLGTVIQSLHPLPSPFAGGSFGTSADVGAVMWPLGAFLIAIGGLIASWDHVESSRGWKRVDPAVVVLLAGLGLFVAAYFTSATRGFPALLSWNSLVLRWTQPLFWIALSVFATVIVVLWLVVSAATAEPPPGLIGAVVGFGIYGLVRSVDGLGSIGAAGFTPGPSEYLGIAGGALLLVGAAVVGRGRRLFPVTNESRTPSP